MYQFLLNSLAVLGRRTFLLQFLAYIDRNSLDLSRLLIGLDQHDDQLQLLRIIRIYYEYICNFQIKVLQEMLWMIYSGVIRILLMEQSQTVFTWYQTQSVAVNQMCFINSDKITQSLPPSQCSYFNLETHYQVKLQKLEKVQTMCTIKTNIFTTIFNLYLIDSRRG